MAGAEKQKVAAAVLLSSPVLPLLFQGEEYAEEAPFDYFTSHTDPALVEAVRVGRHAEYEHLLEAGVGMEAWSDPQDPATFERSKLRWETLERSPHAETLALYRAFLALRRRLTPLRNGRKDLTRVDFDPVGRWLSIHRRDPGGLATVTVANLTEAALDVPLPTEARPLAAGALQRRKERPGHRPRKLRQRTPDGSAAFRRGRVERRGKHGAGAGAGRLRRRRAPPRALGWSCRPSSMIESEPYPTPYPLPAAKALAGQLRYPKMVPSSPNRTARNTTSPLPRSSSGIERGPSMIIASAVGNLITAMTPVHAPLTRRPLVSRLERTEASASARWTSNATSGNAVHLRPLPVGGLRL